MIVSIVKTSWVISMVSMVLSHSSNASQEIMTNILQHSYGYRSKPWYLVNNKIAGKWLFIPL